MEFMMFFGIAIILFIVFIGITSARGQIFSSDKEAEIAKDYAKIIQSEIIIASQVSDGYYREFYVKNQSDGIKMNITNRANRIYVSTKNHEINLKIPEVEGNIIYGKNIIRKENGKIYLN